jgi:hypothetical protein
VSAQTQTAVEYYYAAWDYYFVTSFPDEIAILDGAHSVVFGNAPGNVQRLTGPTGGALATCRFFSTNFAPKSSHFYTPFATECATVQANRDWQFESIAFYLQLPNAAGVCPVGTTVLYRLYNNGMGARQITAISISLATFNLMRAAGWIFEGNGIPAPLHVCRRDRRLRRQRDYGLVRRIPAQRS